MSDDVRAELDELVKALGDYSWFYSSGNRVVVKVHWMEWTGMGSEPASDQIMHMATDKALVCLRALASQKQRAETPTQLTEAEAQWVADALGMPHELRHDVRRVVDMVLAARAERSDD